MPRKSKDPRWMISRLRGYARLMARRPNDEWQRQVDEQAVALAEGSLAPDRAYASRLWPESLRGGTNAALATFEHELRTLKSPSDEDVLDVVKRLVLVLNEISRQHFSAGLMGYETDEREQLCDYIDESLEEVGIGVEALAARQGIGRWEITDRWREW